MTDYEPLIDSPEPPKIPLPSGWPDFALVALLHVVSLARLAIMSARHWPDGPECDGLRLRADNDRLRCEVAMLEQELALKDARFATIEPRRRPRYTASQRFSILLLKSARGWSNSQVARRFHVTVQTVQNWVRAVKENGSLVQWDEKPTRYPDFLRLAVQRLKACCPLLGRNMIADILARTGLHISSSTVRRIINEEPIEPESIEVPSDSPDDESGEPELLHEIIAKSINRVWSIDLTLIPISDGMTTPWSPHALPQVHPYCWHVFTVIDHFSRRIMGVRVFHGPPTNMEITAALDDFMKAEGVKPQDIVSDRGCQFDCKDYREWCKTNGIKWRYGCVGKHGSIAVIERYHRSLKSEFTRRIMVPLSHAEFTHEMDLWVRWFNGWRPHSRHQGKTPDEVYFNKRAENTLPRIETRPRATHRTPCAKPRMMIAGKAGAKVRIELSFLEGKRHLPIVTTTRV